MKKFFTINILVWSFLFPHHSFCQNIREISTWSEDGISYTVCVDDSKGEPNYSGAKVNGILVVPCKYYFVTIRGGHFFAFQGKVFTVPADIYTPEGKLLFPISRGIVDAKILKSSGKAFFKDQKNNWYDENGKFILGGEEYLSTAEFEGRIFIYDKKGNWYNDTGKYVAKGSWLLFDPAGKMYVRTKSGIKNGISTPDGKEILAPEFEHVKCLGDELFSFCINEYWGVINKVGKVLIPTDRAYTRIEYNRTFKKFYFEKEGGYKGECNANGKQTSITKVQTAKPAENKPKESTQKKSSNSSSVSTSSSSELDDNEPGLLIKGSYTIVTDGIPELTVIQVYEDRLKDGNLIFEYKSTTKNGERIYSGDGYFNIFHTFYVNPETGNIRLIKKFNTQYGSNTVTCQVTKGEDLYIRGNFIPGGNPTGGYTPTGGNTEYQWQEHNPTENPVQPHQVTTSCSSCHGSGKCSTCNGKHWYYSASGAKITCPNCKPNGACPSCGGSGKKTTTEYY